MTKSKKTSKTRQKFDFGMEPKVTTLLPTCFKTIAMHSVCRCSLPVWRGSFLKKVTPCDLFWPRPGSAPGGIWPKNNNTCKGQWVLHPYQVSSKSIKRFWRRSWKFESLRTTTTDDDGRTDGRCAMAMAQVSLKICVFMFRRLTLIFGHDTIFYGVLKENYLITIFLTSNVVFGV